MKEVKVKVEFTLGQVTKAQGGGLRYVYTLSLTSALDVVGEKRQAPAALLPGKTRCPIYRRLGTPRAGPNGCGNLAHTRI